jgi:galactose mutarotase-like enzyme
MESIDYQGRKLLKWTHGPSTFLLDAENGGRLINWNIQLADGSFRDIIHWPDLSEKNAQFDWESAQGGHSILFPFAGRSINKEKQNFWKDLQNQEHPMPQNGFAKRSKFKTIKTEAHQIVLELCQDSAFREAYPFEYELTLEYAFDAVGFKVFLSLENLGDRPILWSAGHAFHFKLPWHDHLSVSNYRVAHSAKKQLYPQISGGISGETLSGEAIALNDAGLYKSLLTKLKSNTFKLGPKGGEEDIGITFLEDYPSYSTWNALLLKELNPSNQFLEVHALMSAPNSHSHKKGLHVVEAESKSTFALEISLL